MALIPTQPTGQGARYLTAKEVAQYLRISVYTVYKLVERRQIPFIPLNLSDSAEPRRNLVRFDREKIDEWMAKRAVRPP
jgi:predicted DNA-binding transcriptional regulator AlpA